MNWQLLSDWDELKQAEHDQQAIINMFDRNDDIDTLGEEVVRIRERFNLGSQFNPSIDYQVKVEKITTESPRAPYTPFTPGIPLYYHLLPAL